MEKVKLFEPNLRVDRAHPTRTLDPPMCIVHFFLKKTTACIVYCTDSPKITSNYIPHSS